MLTLPTQFWKTVSNCWSAPTGAVESWRGALSGTRPLSGAFGVAKLCSFPLPSPLVLEHIGKPLLQPLRCSSKTASIDHFSFFVERAVMAPDISKVNADHHLNLRLSAGHFCDKVMRWLFH